nr:MAG TPA: hypothetical protein [Caudoviricetes sp.]
MSTPVRSPPATRASPPRNGQPAMRRRPANGTVSLLRNSPAIL